MSEIQLQTGGGGFSAAQLARQAHSEFGCSPQIVNLLIAYAGELESWLIKTLEGYYTEAGVGGIPLDTYIDRIFVQIWNASKERADAFDLPRMRDS
jgi:hypothetical protein